MTAYVESLREVQQVVRSSAALLDYLGDTAGHCTSSCQCKYCRNYRKLNEIADDLFEEVQKEEREVMKATEQLKRTIREL